MIEALAIGEPAELVWTYLTPEGGVFTEYYRVVGPKLVEVFVDGTKDSYPGGRWTHFSCGGITESKEGFISVGSCREIPIDETVSSPRR